MTSIDARRSKAALLLRLLRQNPGEFRDRMRTAAEFQLDRLRRPASWAPRNAAETQELLRPVVGDLAPALEEKPLREIEEEVSREQGRLDRTPGIESYHDADFTLGRFCYAICRMRQPDVVVETGVARGVSSAFLLQALAVNGQGQLWSIDLPPLRDTLDGQCGCLVPERLRARWHVLRGPTRRLLPDLVSQLPAIDLFLHDSLHTFSTMWSEFRTVWPKLRAGGVLICDDAERNRAFESFARRRDVGLAVTMAEARKAAAFGVMVKAAP